MTPRLVELVRGLRDRNLEQKDRNGDMMYYGPDDPVLVQAADELERLSRLMAEGGLVGAGATPLEVGKNGSVGNIELAAEQAYLLFSNSPLKPWSSLQEGQRAFWRDSCSAIIMRYHQ